MAVQTSSASGTTHATLVTTDWVARQLTDPAIRIVEVDVDTKAYDEGHVPNAAGWAWDTQLCDTLRRDIIPKAKFEQLLGASGIGNRTTVILYGDNNNWFAAWAFWQLKVYGHTDVRLVTGRATRRRGCGGPQPQPANSGVVTLGLARLESGARLVGVPERQEHGHL